MADDSLQRFQKVMDKLYHSPKQKSSPLNSGRGVDSLQKSRRIEWGFRRGEENGSRALSSVSKEANACRPWDRRDLMRRLATFKAMTWFGKPKAVSALNCARRGWVNVGMDTIACEACGSRLLFSTPSSWTFQQVEKAAAVFSLKLDNGHKLLCPWMDNTCDESLALFPPTPLPELFKAYEERSNALLQLSALPVISSSAISWMRCAELEWVLKDSSSLDCTLENGIKITERSAAGNEELVSDTATPSLYFQAKTIIALCGWEVRILPYSVESEYVNKSDEKALSGISRETSRSINSAVAISSQGNLLEVNGKKYIDPSVRGQPDLASSVLDCKLCGACVGLWMFKSIPRPLEAFILTDAADSVGQNSSTAEHAGGNSQNLSDSIGGPNLNKGNMNRERNSALNLTIAGGVPPMKQNFRPRISFPIVSRYLRADLSSTEYAEPQDRTGVELTKSVKILKRKRDEDSCHLSDGGKSDVPPDQNEDVNGQEDSGGHGHQVLFNQGNDVCGNEPPPVDDENYNNSEVSNSNRSTEPVSASSSHDNHNEPLVVGLSVSNATASDSIPADSGQGITASGGQVSGLNDTIVSHNVDQLMEPLVQGSKSFPPRFNDMEEFDPIKQHRPFCPWISPSDGKYLPGWKLTLQALGKKGGSPQHKEGRGILSDEGNDPLVCVRKLFSSPPSKQRKCS